MKTGVTSGDSNLSLDIGNDGTADLTHNVTTNFPTTLNAVNSGRLPSTPT